MTTQKKPDRQSEKRHAARALNKASAKLPTIGGARFRARAEVQGQALQPAPMPNGLSPEQAERLKAARRRQQETRERIETLMTPAQPAPMPQATSQAPPQLSPEQIAEAAQSGRPQPPNRRGSPEAVEKRRVAANSRGRKLLDSLDKPRKPFQLLQSIEELLKLGYLRGDIRAALPISNTVTMPKVENPVMVTFLRKIHNLYGFRRETYLLAGFSKDVLSKAQIV